MVWIVYLLFFFFFSIKLAISKISSHGGNLIISTIESF